MPLFSHLHRVTVEMCTGCVPRFLCIINFSVHKQNTKIQINKMKIWFHKNQRPKTGHGYNGMLSPKFQQWSLITDNNDPKCLICSNCSSGFRFEARVLKVSGGECLGFGVESMLKFSSNVKKWSETRSWLLLQRVIVCQSHFPGLPMKPSYDDIQWQNPSKQTHPT